MALHLPIGPLKSRYGLEPVPRCEPSTYQPISQRLSHCAIGAGFPALLPRINTLIYSRQWVSSTNSYLQWLMRPATSKCFVVLKSTWRLIQLELNGVENSLSGLLLFISINKTSQTFNSLVAKCVNTMLCRNILLKDTLDTFYLRLYVVGCMVMDHLR